MTTVVVAQGAAVGDQPSRRWQSTRYASLLIALTLCTYLPVFRCGFVNYDDDKYVTANAHLKEGLTWDGLRWGLTTNYFSNWHPLVWWSFMLDHQVFGMTAWGFHLTNLLWHVASVLLLFAALTRLTGASGPSLLVAALFAVHPINVQAVAWVSERKGVLSTFFWMLTLWAYARYVERPGWRWYLLLGLSLTLGLMAKQMLVTVPCVLLLLDCWPLRRWAPADGPARLLPLVLEKVPLFALVALASVLAVVAQHEGAALAPLEALPLSARIRNVPCAYLAYLGQLLFPMNLAVFYPHAGEARPWWQAAAATLVLGALTLGALTRWSRAPYLTVGWLWFIGTLVPVIGLVQLGEQGRADRYAYIPAVGLFIALAWSVAVLARGERRTSVALVCGVALLLLAATAWGQLGHWRDSVRLWEQAIRATGGSHIAHLGLGAALEERGDEEGALRQYQEVLRYRPQHDGAHSNLGLLLLNRGLLAEANAHLEQALRANPLSAAAHNNRGLLLLKQGQAAQAVSWFDKALQLRPDYAPAHLNLGLYALEQGDLRRAERHFRDAVAASPHDPRAMNNLGYVLMTQGDVRQAARYFRQALALKADFLLAHNNLGTALLDQGDAAAAAVHFQEAVRLNDRLAGSHTNLGLAYEAQEDWTSAIGCFHRALALQPNGARQHRELAFALQHQNLAKEAQAEYDRSLQLDPRWPESVRSSAWVLATHPESGPQQAQRALRLVRQLCQATGQDDPRVLDTLAVALAASGDFSQAAALARRASSLAAAGGDGALARQIDERVLLYENGQPFRAPPPLSQ